MKSLSLPSFGLVLLLSVPLTSSAGEGCEACVCCEEAACCAPASAGQPAEEERAVVAADAVELRRELKRLVETYVADPEQLAEILGQLSRDLRRAYGHPGIKLAEFTPADQDLYRAMAVRLDS